MQYVRPVILQVKRFKCFVFVWSNPYTKFSHNSFLLHCQIAYKSEYEQEKTEQGEYNYPADITPSYQTQKKLEPLKDVSVCIFDLIIIIMTSI